MILERLRVKNWAGHRERDIAFGGAITGLVGDNGSGKTTLIRAIVYALFGKLAEKKKASNVIRDFGQPMGASEAEVEADFNNRGERFNIFRKLAVKGSERTLTLSDGSSFTYADQVDEQISNILGADLDTIINVIYIPQGDLKNILFGTEAEQERLLIKILNVGYLQDVYKALAAKISLVQTKVDSTIDSRLEKLEMDILQQTKDLEAIQLEVNNLVPVNEGDHSLCMSLLMTLESADFNFRTINKKIADLKSEYSDMNAGGKLESIKNKMLLDKGASDVNGIIRALQQDVKLTDFAFTIIDAIITIISDINTTEVMRLDINTIKAMTDFWNTGISPSAISMLRKIIVNGKPDLDFIDANVQTKTKELELEQKRLSDILSDLAVIEAQATALSYYDSVDCTHDSNCTQCGSTLTAEAIALNKCKYYETLTSFEEKSLGKKSSQAEVIKLQSELIELTSQYNTAKLELSSVPDKAIEIYQANPSELLLDKSILEKQINLEATLGNHNLNLNNLIDRFNTGMVKFSLPVFERKDFENGAAKTRVSDIKDSLLQEIATLQLSNQATVTAEDRAFVELAESKLKAIETNTTAADISLNQIREVESDLDHQGLFDA